MCRAVLGLDAFAGDARADHFREAVDVDRVHVEALLDLGPHRVGPRLGAEDADLQAAVARIEALPAELVEDGEHVGGRHHHDLGLEVVDELHLPLRHAAGDGNDRAAEPLRAVMRAEAAGEQAVAVGDMDLHARPAAGGANRSRHHVRPHVDVGLGVGDHGRLAGRAGGGVDARDPVVRHGDHAERIGCRAGRPWS